MIDVVMETLILKVTELAPDFGWRCIVLSLVISFCICIHEHKGKFWERIAHYRNKFYFVFLILFSSLIVALSYWRIVTFIWQCALLAVYAPYCMLCFKALSPRIGFTHLIIKKYKKSLDQGLVIENISFFEAKRAWTFWDSDERIEYQHLKALYFANSEDYLTAYNALCAIDKQHLYKEEAEYFNMRKAMYISLLGSLKTALHLLGNPDDNKSKDPMIWITYAYIFENLGDIGKAFELAQKAKDMLSVVENISASQRAAVYNDYGRYAFYHGNESECLHYYKKSFEEAKKSNNAHCLNIVASNVITRTAIFGDVNFCKRIFGEYLTNVKVKSIDNKLEYNNMKIVYYRQTNDKRKVYELIKSGYEEIKDELATPKQELFKASTLRMLMSGHYRHDWFDDDVISKVEPYMILSLPERLQIFKEYYSYYMQAEFRTIYLIEPYKTLKFNIHSYYEGSCLSEIDEFLVGIDSYNIRLYYNMVLHKLFILKLLQGKEHILLSKQLYIDLYKKLLGENLEIDAANIIMIFIDECCSPYNIQLRQLFSQNYFYYSDYIDANPPPLPRESEDGIHLDYPTLFPLTGIEILPLQVSEISEAIELLIPLYQKWQNHPAKVELSVGIAKTLMCIGRRDDAKPYWDYFCGSKLSAEHFAPWFKAYLNMLQREFGAFREPTKQQNV